MVGIKIVEFKIFMLKNASKVCLNYDVFGIWGPQDKKYHGPWLRCYTVATTAIGFPCRGNSLKLTKRYFNYLTVYQPYPSQYFNSQSSFFNPPQPIPLPTHPEAYFNL